MNNEIFIEEPSKAFHKAHVTSNAVDNNWRKCKHCGKFISYKQMEEQKDVMFHFVPDTEFTVEERIGFIGIAGNDMANKRSAGLIAHGRCSDCGGDVLTERDGCSGIRALRFICLLCAGLLSQTCDITADAIRRWG